MTDSGEGLNGDYTASGPPRRPPLPLAPGMTSYSRDALLPLQAPTKGNRIHRGTYTQHGILARP